MLLTIDRHGFKIRCDLELRFLTASDRVRSGYDNRSVVSVSSGTIFRHFSGKFHIVIGSRLTFSRIDEYVCFRCNCNPVNNFFSIAILQAGITKTKT